MTIKTRLATAALVAVSGALVMIVILLTDGMGSIKKPDLPFIWAAGAGAGMAGLLVAPLFGRAGRYRNLWAMAGAVLATTLGAALAGVMMEPGMIGAALIIAPVFVGAALFEYPVSGLTWLLSMWLIHVSARAMRG